MASPDNPKTIELYGQGCQHEGEAAAAVTPGHLVERDANGEIAVHSTAGGGGNPHFANEYDLTGRGIDDDYADGDQIIFTTYAPGSSVFALVAAAAPAIAVGDFLVSDGDGTLKKAGLDEVAFAQALEAVDNSGGGTAVRIKVEVVAPFRTAAA